MLYIVPTPIGNLEDMTFRAVRILKEVDYIFAEDTRNTKKLLNHFDIENIIYQYHAHNKQVDTVLRLLEQGKDVALVTDAGTPCISDPGYRLVNEAYKKGMEVTSLPGASAVTTAASGSGLNMRRFVFEGFLPKKKGRNTILTKLKEEERAIIFFESPNRIIKTLVEIKEVLGNRYVVISREITKLYEEIIRGNIEEILTKLENKTIKGEIVLLIDAKGEKR
ncbi:MAG: 16S rRNA (cytidine(1402)-2'-O)-methyltransferase [Fusobacteriia bacterium 4572_132]|nr:MAG: 16S rRNA (cytidine(1402)-2'-O)-methyltransferase [Fusobacteriia bacterium 4572_132]